MTNQQPIVQNKQQIREKDLVVWLEHPITRTLLALIKEHRDACLEIIDLKVLNTEPISTLDIADLAQFRGQYFSLDKIYEIREFLEETLEERKDVDEETNSIGPKLNP